MNDKDLDKLVSERSGVEIVPLDTRYTIPQHKFIFKGKVYYYEWTLKDARCREAAREYFRIETNSFHYINGDWKATANIPRGFTSGRGKTIAEAEIACIRAIIESEVSK